jgi:hypothetical protein
MTVIGKFENNFLFVVKEIYNRRYGFFDELKYFHRVLDSSLISKKDKKYNTELKELGKDRNSIFYDDYHKFIDADDRFNKIYNSFINEHIKPIYGIDDKVVVQKTPNLRISFPKLAALGKRVEENEKDNIIGLHKDSDFGHHEEEINFIIPITDMFETNSIYYEPFSNSDLPKDQYINLNIKTSEYLTVKFNQLLHYNKINETGVTRISLDFRIIPYDKYMNNISNFAGTKFELDKYYIIV